MKSEKGVSPRSPLEVPWLFGSGLPFEWYSRDAVHSGECGKQIIGRTLLGYLMSGRDVNLRK